MLLASTAVCAAEPREKTAAAADASAIAVVATRNPVDKSYRKMLKGMDLFEARHSMAPNASLRYKLLPRQRDTNMDGIEVDIVGDSFTIPVEVAPDRSFTLERQQKALAENASVRPNRQANSMTWRTEIRTPGLPPDTRRLGDMRLECMVGVEAGLVSDVSLIGTFLDKLMGYCEKEVVHYYFFAPRPLFSVTLTAGSRREILSVDELYAGASYGLTPKSDMPYCDCQALLDRTYFLPLGDRSWPDDTLIELEYMDGAAENTTSR